MTTTANVDELLSLLAAFEADARALGVTVDTTALHAQLEAARPRPLVPMIGARISNKQYDAGPSDWLDPARIPTPAVPFQVFDNALDYTIAPSRKGQARHGAGYVLLPFTGQPGGLYMPDPTITAGECAQQYPQRGTDPLEILKALAGNGAIGDMGTRAPPYRQLLGTRGTSAVIPYTTWRGHPRTRRDGTVNTALRLPLFIGLTLQGELLFMDRLGAVSSAIKIPGLLAPLDFSFNPADRMLFTIADTYNGRLVQIDRTGEGSPPDPSKWGIVYGPALYKRPTSVRTTDAGITWLVDNGTGQIFRDGVPVYTIVNAFWCDYTSTGDVVVATRTAGLYLLDGTSGAIKRELRVPDGNVAQWATVSVDRAGAFGVVDDCVMIRATGGDAENFNNTEGWWAAIDGSYIAGFRKIFPGNSIYSIGNAANCKDPHGHYPWVAEFHPEEACLLVQGFSGAHPAIIRPRLATDPKEDAYNHPRVGAGTRVLISGTAKGMPPCRPSFTQQLSEHVGGNVTNADVLAALSFDELAALIQAGLYGSTPRPELTGPDLGALMYLVLRSSQRWLLAGGALIASLDAWLLPQLGGPAPTITPRGNRTNADGSVTWFFDTDVPTMAYVAAGGPDRNYYRWTQPSRGLALNHALTMFWPPAGMTASLRARSAGGIWTWRSDTGAAEVPGEFLPTEIMDYPMATQVELQLLNGQVFATYSGGYPERVLRPVSAPAVIATLDAGTPGERVLGTVPCASGPISGVHTLFPTVLAPGYRARPSIVRLP